jgi:5-formyltetrahydrofolate cyclo-ligase
MGSTADDIDLDRRKNEIRKKAKAARAALSMKQRYDLSWQVCDILLAMPAVKQADIVAVYAAMPEELSLGHLIGALNDRRSVAVFPATLGNRQMTFHVVEPGNRPDFIEHPNRIAKNPNPLTRVDEDRFDVVIVPGVAFDTHGNRLGYGGGYYDTLLEKLEDTKCKVIAVAFDEQVFDEIPVGPTDRKIPVLVTPQHVYVND